MFHFYLSGRWPAKDDITEYCENILNHFFKKPLKRNVDIHLVMRSKITEGKYITGFCYGDKDEITIELSRNELAENGKYKLRSIEDILVTLAHELVHAKQFIKKELKRDVDSYFKGRYYKDATYYNHPSEHEAYMMEGFLYDLYWKNYRKIGITKIIF